MGGGSFPSRTSEREQPGLVAELARRCELKIRWRKAPCRFESDLGHFYVSLLLWVEGNRWIRKGLPVFLFLIIFIYKIFRIYYIIVMEMEINKTIKIKRGLSLLELKIRNILDVIKSTGYIELRFWSSIDGQIKFLYLFDDVPITWYDKDGNESTDYQKLVDTLSVYAEQTKLKDAIASLN